MFFLVGVTPVLNLELIQIICALYYMIFVSTYRCNYFFFQVLSSLWSQFFFERGLEPRIPPPPQGSEVALPLHQPSELLEHLLAECKRHGETLVTEGVITHKDIEDCRSGKGRNAVISIGLPAYCFLQALLRSAKANSDGLLLSDNTEITTGNRPKDTFFDYFFDPLLIMKEQIRVENLTAEEEEYLSKLVLLLSDPERLKTLHGGLPPDNERRLAEINALARRLHGITRSISRYPTMKRRFDEIMKSLSEELEKEMGGGSQSANKYQSTQRIRSGFVRMFSQKSVMNDKSSTEECRVDMEDERQSGNGAVNM